MDSFQDCLRSAHSPGAFEPLDDAPTEEHPNRVKDQELHKMGFEPTEYPVAAPCRKCGYRRRYSAPALADRCLWCDAVNQ